MRCRILSMGLLTAALLCGATTSALAGWDFNNKIKHEDDGVTGHECASDFHLELTVGNDDVSEATAKADSPSQTQAGTVTYTGSGASRRANITWNFDPCIDRGETVEFQVKATGRSLPPDEAYWTYPSGRGGSICMAGIELDSGDAFVFHNSPATPLLGEVRYASLSTPYLIDDLQYGHIPGLGAPEVLNLSPGGSTVIAAPAPSIPGHAVVFEISAWGTGADSLRSVMQYVLVPSQPAASDAGLVLVAMLLLACGGAAAFARTRSGVRLS